MIYLKYELRYKESTMPLTSINPATGELLESFTEQSAAQVDDCVTKAHEAFRDWRKSGYSRRRALLLLGAADEHGNGQAGSPGGSGNR
jgi:acyl-CoA reductase-like NAD-dependent aldehyde dehydrogenase